MKAFQFVYILEDGRGLFLYDHLEVTVLLTQRQASGPRAYAPEGRAKNENHTSGKTQKPPYPGTDGPRRNESGRGLKIEIQRCP
jgi:hypothetical protein